MKVVIIEDEALAAQRLAKMVNDYDPAIEILAQLESVEESVEWFKANEHPDLIFLDIHLEDDLSFAIFDQVNISSPIIFTTAFDEYAIKAFKLKSIDYLLKPIVQEELNAALGKYKEMMGDNRLAPDLSSLYDLIVKKGESYRKRFSVSVAQKIKTFATTDVAYFQSEDGYTVAYLNEGKKYFLDISLDKLQQEIDPKLFHRINRKLLLAMDAIHEVHIFPKGRLKLDIKPKLEDEVFVSIDRAPKFKRWLGGEGGREEL